MSLYFVYIKKLLLISQLIRPLLQLYNVLSCNALRDSIKRKIDYPVSTESSSATTGVFIVLYLLHSLVASEHSQAPS